MKAATPRRNRARLRELEERFASASPVAAPAAGEQADAGELAVEVAEDAADGIRVVARAPDGALLTLSSQDGSAWSGTIHLAGAAARRIAFSLDRAISGMNAAGLARRLLSRALSRVRGRDLEL